LAKAPTARRRPRKPRRDLHDLEGLPRSAAQSQFRAALERAGEDPAPSRPPLANLAAPALWNWVRSYLRYAFQRSHPFVPHTKHPTHCIYPLGDGAGTGVVRVSLAGDWASGTAEAVQAAQGMMRSDPHFTIHLGDIYYVGDELALLENCLGIDNPKTLYAPATWPIGSLGSFALNGNHEMYANGRPYFERFLPRLGLRTPDGMSGQVTSFFCLQNDYWRIIGLDTGYHSRGWPIIGLIRQLSCPLNLKLLAWLREIVRPKDDKRGIILLSHHQYYTVFPDDHSYTLPAQQLKEFIDRPALWFWGHEHRLAGYELWGPKDLQVHGRCIGHGGMPVRPQPPPRREGSHLLFYDNRYYKDGFNHNGYATLEFRGPRMTARYFDISGINPGASDRLLLEEQWKVDSAGAVVRESLRQLCRDVDFYGPEKWG